jgi:hypothetical protein
MFAKKVPAKKFSKFEVDAYAIARYHEEHDNVAQEVKQ